MKKVTIYSTRICPYCVRAKNFFTKKEIQFEDIMIDQNPEEMKTMMDVGGFDDLIEHDMDGKLEDLLKD